jgi:hypothetical protein
MEWRRRLGRIAALFGMLAMLLPAVAPAAAHAPSDRTLARASSHDVGLLSQSALNERAVDHPGFTRQGPASCTIAFDPGAPPPDCPYGDGKTCCAMSACPAFTMACSTGTAFAVTWAGMAADFTGSGAAGHAGPDALPPTPPPRGHA